MGSAGLDRHRRVPWPFVVSLAALIGVGAALVIVALPGEDDEPACVASAAITCAAPTPGP